MSITTYSTIRMLTAAVALEDEPISMSPSLPRSVR
jgi:hypothetical protein